MLLTVAPFQKNVYEGFHEPIVCLHSRLWALCLACKAQTPFYGEYPVNIRKRVGLSSYDNHMKRVSFLSFDEFQLGL